MIEVINTFSGTFSKLYIIWGQSNAVGQATGIPSESYLNDPIPNTYIWTGSAWQQLEIGVNNEASNATSHGIELNLGYLAQAHYGTDIYIVKKAEAGRALGNETGEVRDFDKPSGGEMYSELVAKVNAATANLVANGVRFEVGGVYGNQGERDANFESLANAYEANIAAFYGFIDTDIGYLENSKKVLGRLRTDIVNPYRATVRAAQETVDYVNADDVTLHDGLHYDSAGQNTVAQRVFDFFKQ